MYNESVEYGVRAKFNSSVSRAVKWLLISNIAVFLIVSLGSKFNILNESTIYNTFGQVNSILFAEFKPWQLFTSLFIHGDILHLLNNMFALWIFGTALEQEWSSRRFVFLYFFCGIGSAFLHYCIEPASTIPGIGASGAIFGILGVCGLILGNREVYLFMAVIKLKYIVAIYACIEIYMCVIGSRDGIGHWVHLSGFILGILYVRIYDRILERRSNPGCGRKKNNRFDNIELD